MQGYDHLVRKAQAAEGKAREEAFNELIAPFTSVAHAWAYAALGDTHLAQDVVQEAFLTAYQKIDQLRDPEAFPAWLKRIVLTYCNRATRRKSPLLLPLEDETGSDSSTPLHDDPAVSAEEREREEQVNRAVQGLPELERVVTELFYITGYSQQEIAERLAVPLTTVKKRLQYAREHLREAMPPMNMLTYDIADFAPYDPTFAGIAPPLPAPDADDELWRLLAELYPEMFTTIG
jgi:RNA polymerase sigma-70 factor (ECF subfamily)